MPVEVRQFKYFASVVECRSMTRASARTGISQPSLSQQIRNLEDEIGTLLLVRSSQGVEPTEAGLKLYMHAQRILRELEDAAEEARLAGEGDTFGGSISVGLPNTAATMLGGPLYSALRAANPGLKLRMLDGMSGNLLEHLMNGRLDLVLQFGHSKLPGLLSRPLYSETLYFVERTAVPDDRPISWDEARQRQVVIPSAPHGMRHTLDGYMETHGVLQSVMAEVDSLVILQDIVASGEAASFLPGATVRGIDPSQISMRAVLGAPLERTICICTRIDPPDPHLTAHVIEQLRTIVATGVAKGTWRGVRFLGD